MTYDPTLQPGYIDPRSKAKMANDLNAFDRAMSKVSNKATSNLREQLNYNNGDNMLHEAAVTRTVTMPTATAGVQVGNFAVFAMPNANGKNRYDVANMTTGEKIVGGLHLAEGANAIVKLLNRQYSFYSPQIKQILEHEQNYVKFYQDAVSFQRKVKDSPIKDAILETRFSEAKRSAQIVKEKLENYVKIL